MDLYREKKATLIAEIGQACSRISISFDLRSSPNALGMIGVVGMWVGRGGRRSSVLGLRCIDGEHTGENVAAAVLEVLHEFAITGQNIGNFMLDNAAKNDVAVKYILEELCPEMTARERRHRRLRCLGHIVNLCCKAFILGKQGDSGQEDEFLAEPRVSQFLGRRSVIEEN